VRDELLLYQWIFSTSYDLLVYWAMGCGGSFSPFIDHFRGPRLEFDPDRADVFADQVPVYFLHGALHLVVGGSGVTWKLRRGAMQTVLDQFGEPIDGDLDALNEHPRRPIAVSMLPESPRVLAAKKADVYARLEIDELRFFDATTHPLGDRGLRAVAP
jgi:hypothetical protein